MPRGTKHVVPTIGCRAVELSEQGRCVCCGDRLDDSRRYMLIQGWWRRTPQDIILFKSCDACMFQHGFTCGDELVFLDGRVVEVDSVARGEH